MIVGSVKCSIDECVHFSKCSAGNGEEFSPKLDTDAWGAQMLVRCESHKERITDCPECGESITPDDSSCPKCGESFI